VLDRELAQALKEIEQGKTFGPFNFAKDLIRSLNREARKLKKKLLDVPRLFPSVSKELGQNSPRVQRLFEKQVEFLLENLRHLPYESESTTN
jgi:hypothetical protein